MDQMSDEITIPVVTPDRQRDVLFRERALTALDATNHTYVTISSVAKAFGLKSPSLTRRLNRKMGYFSQYAAKIKTVTAGGPQDLWCLDATALPLFLTGEDLSDCDSPADREILEVFLREVHIVLAEHFGISERSEMKVLTDTVAHLVHQQMAHDEGVTPKEARQAVSEADYVLREEYDEKLNSIRVAFGDLRQYASRAADIAGHLSEQRLTPEMIGTVQNSVQTLGGMLEELGAIKPYQGIYRAIFQLTNVGATERIRIRDFERVMSFLERRIEAINKAPHLSADEIQQYLDMLIPRQGE